MKMQADWYLALLSLVGFYRLPEIWAYFQGTGSLWDLANILWFAWLLYLLPEELEESNHKEQK